MIDEVRLITKEIAKRLLPQRSENSHKGTFGKVLNIAGSQFYQGAAYFSSLAPLKVGAGLVTLATIETVIQNLASTAPWMTFYPLRDYKDKCIAGDAFSQLKEIENSYNVFSIGSGLSDLPALSSFLDDFGIYYKNSEKKFIFDADALNVISKFEKITFPKNTVITPHPMELSRLIDVPVNVIQSDRIKYARYAAEKFECNVVLKGHKSLVCLQNGLIYENTTGGNALAKAGSGDVLTGIIAGLAAQGLTIEKAAILGVYLHGLCGDIATEDLTSYCVLATDQINYLPKAIKFLIKDN